MGIFEVKKSNYPRGQYFDPNQWNTVSREIIQKEDRIRDTHPATLLQKKRLEAPEIVAYAKKVKSYFPIGKAQYEKRSVYDLIHPKGRYSYNIYLKSLPKNDFDLRPAIDPDEQDKKMIQPYRTSGTYGHYCCRYHINCPDEKPFHCKDFVRRAVLEESCFRDNGLHPMQPSWIQKDPMEMSLQQEDVVAKMPKTSVKRDNGAIIGVWGNVFKTW